MLQIEPAPRPDAAEARASIRRRALADALPLGAAVAAAPFFATDPIDRLLAAIAAVGAAIVIYVARRGQDFERFARLARAREAQFRRHGIPLAAWHGGQPLAPWTARMSRQADPQG
jgi:Na+/H+ antiporter NhaD/arsenite permease-like protein